MTAACRDVSRQQLPPLSGDASWAILTAGFLISAPGGMHGVIPVYLNLTQGSREEYGSSYATYEKHITYLASQKCNVIAIEGAPPFMLLGPGREAEMVDGWKRKYNTDKRGAVS